MPQQGMAKINSTTGTAKMSVAAPIPSAKVISNAIVKSFQLQQYG